MPMVKELCRARRSGSARGPSAPSASARNPGMCVPASYLAKELEETRRKIKSALKRSSRAGYGAYADDAKRRHYRR